MSVLLSPGVLSREIDATNSVPSTSSSVGGYVGPFEWGPVDKATLVSSPKELLNTYGRPQIDTSESFLTAESFLKYTSALQVIRVGETVTTNAKTADASNVVVKNEDDTDALALADGPFCARYPGDIANGLEVCYALYDEDLDDGGFVEPASGITTGTILDGLVNDEAGQSSFVIAQNVSGDYDGYWDEIHVVVIDTLGKFSGTPGTVLEVFEGLSTLKDAVNESGESIFVDTVINRRSKYIWSTLENYADMGGFYVESPIGQNLVDITDSDDYAIEKATDFDTNGFTLTGATDLNDSLSAGAITTGLDLFSDSDSIDVSLLFAYHETTDTASYDTTIGNKLISVSETRGDSLAVVSPPAEHSSSGVAAVKTFFDTLSSSSFVTFTSSRAYVYDRYNDRNTYVSTAGHVAGLCAQTDEVADTWFSPAGYTRGQLKDVIRLEINPNQTQRDTLYKARINPIVTQPGQGTLLFGDKTGLSKRSAFDRINVRRLFNVLRKSIGESAKYQLFEFNDEFTRATFRNAVNPFLRNIKGRRGITDFLVVCDETNNTGEVIDAQEFVGDIYVKPARSINFIRLNFIATRTGVEFTEQVGLSNA